MALELSARGPVAVVIPSFRVSAHILEVLASIGPEVSKIYVVDDACPDKSGDLVERECRDPRVTVLRNPHNLGVGGAVLNGYRAAVADGCMCIVKIDGDGQMDPSLLPLFVEPVLSGRADYTKGNRFHYVSSARQMPFVRWFGNVVLSFMNKISSGYWRVFDPTNGYTVIDARLAAALPFERIASRYFFESDMLFRIGLLGGVVEDIPMEAKYGDERSGLRIGLVIHQFLLGHVRNAFKRIVYSYFLRDFSVASVELVLGLALVFFSLAFGTHAWRQSTSSGVVASSGTVMLSAFPALVGIQLLLSFLAFDVGAAPRVPISSRLPGRRQLAK